MTERENYMKVCNGERAEWVPNYMQAVTFFTPQVLKDPNVELYGMLAANDNDMSKKYIAQDAYGIKWTLDDYGPMPLPGWCLFEEIEDWRDKVTIPDLGGYDWDKACKDDTAFVEPDKAVQLGLYGPFTQLYNAMGFENAMVAVFENPDEVMKLFDAMTTFMEEVLKGSMARAKVDSVVMYDDIANANNLFISRDTYAKIVKPFHKRVFDMAKKMNKEVSLEMHCCGKCEALIDDFVEIGSMVWQPAQTLNDLEGIRKKYGNKLIFNGVWDNIGICGKENAAEEEVRKEVHNSIDKFGADGGLIFWDSQVGAGEDMMKKMEWVNDEVDVYGHQVYKNIKFNKDELKVVGNFPKVEGDFTNVPGVFDTKLNTPITPKENWDRFFKRQNPLWIPDGTYDVNFMSPYNIPDCKASSFIGGYDSFGVKWIPDESCPELPAFVEPGFVVLDDIENWRDMKWPDVDSW